MDDSTLAKLRQGDPVALRECLLIVNQWVRTQKQIPPADAEDIVLEAIERAVIAADSYRGEAKVETWLHQIASNTWVDNCRQRGRHAPWADSLDEKPGETASNAFDPEEMAFRRMAAEEAMGLLSKLSEDERQAFVLRVVHGLSSEQIAQRLERTVDAVRCLKYRAAKKLDAFRRDFGVDI